MIPASIRTIYGVNFFRELAHDLRHFKLDLIHDSGTFPRAPSKTVTKTLWENPFPFMGDSMFLS